jgi:hypothetical protein
MVQSGDIKAAVKGSRRLKRKDCMNQEKRHSQSHIKWKKNWTLKCNNEIK